MASSATLNIRVAPRRMLTLREAADYCGLPVKRFPVDCHVTPIAMPSGGKVYDMRDLDDFIDALKGGESAGDDAIIARLG
ncbi:hypothetical protein RMS29_001760 [Agrobacterium rosae]|uniref:DNA-binding protein n=1 Tax=Agrobacterium rosae TaxID=1972867 RepID=A0ABU4VVX3_9HYPH|nr:hypothetical protein [Agrobacterium rosae]MDX8329645.1 hypothetical protein [Agrobacterium rosae]